MSMVDPRSESYYRHLCENLGVAVIAADVDLNISLWSSAASRMFGAAEPQMLGAPIVTIMEQNRRPEIEAMLHRVLDTGEVVEFEFDCPNARGERRELAGTISPVPGVSGHRVGLSVCFRDITRRIALQEAVAQGRKMGALGEMAGAIAHHFNNILGGVVTSIDFARARHDPEIDRRVLEQLGGALGRANSLIAGLLAFAQGDPRCDDRSDLGDILRAVVAEFDESFDAQHIRCALDAEGLPLVPVARTQVETILRNIIQNAMEAMPEGGSLSVTAMIAGGAAVVRVTDTGVGLDPEALSRVFEPFWTTKGALASCPGQAAGLGLAIAHGLAQMIGGSISAASQPDRGSCFTLTLPTSARPA
jgi:PAS domain S-box-containing protein